MKKKFIILLANLLLSVMLISQDAITYNKMADSLFAPISKGQITTGILYDRVMPFSGLHAFKNTDTSSYMHFFLAYSELYNAAYNNGTMMNAAQIDTLSNAIYYTNSVIPVGVLYYDFNLIDTLAITNNLFYRGSDSLLHDVVGRTGNPFKLKTITVAAALSQDTLNYGTGNITFRYINQLFLTNKAATITSIYADFGGGNQNLSSGNNVTVFYPTAGRKTIKFTITYSNAQTTTVYSKIFLRSPSVSNRLGEPIAPDATVEFDDITYGYQGFGETTKKYNRGEYGIYYHKTSPGGPKEMVLKKPIIILDGFDPLEKRQIRDLYGVYLQYTSSANFGNDMLDLGYDVIILNFPNKTESRTIYRPNLGTLNYKEKRAQGADFIQRNAFLLVTLIKKINQQLIVNNSAEKLVVIGPSMGGLISRYALRWMELNGETHNTKLWISFDAPHKGANIPIGDQYFIDFYASKLNSESAKDAKNNSLNSPAAQQMLLHHFTANSTTPAGAPNFRNNWQTELDNLGYPQNLRKIALINGAINGTTQGNACQNVYKLNVNIHAHNAFLFFTQILKVTEGNIWFAGNYGSTCQVFKGWSAAPFLANTKAAAAPSASKSYDILPGGYYDAQAQLGGNNFKFSLLFDKIYKPTVMTITGYFGMWTETNAQTLNPNHCFIPTFSALGMDINNKDLSESLYNRDLSCTGETPFQAYYAPLTNEEHITLTPQNVAWIKAEIAGNKQMSSVNYTLLYPMVKTSGADPLCTMATYQINNLPTGSTIAWQSSNPTIATVSATGNPTTITRQGTQNGVVTITAIITRSCGSPVTISKTLAIGKPNVNNINITYNSPTSVNQQLFPLAPHDLTTHYDACRSLQIDVGNLPTGTTITWNATVSPGATWQQTGNNFTCFFNGLNQTAQVSASFTNPCGSTTANYRFKCVNNNLCGGPTPSRAIISPIKLMVSPNPAQQTVNVAFEGNTKIMANKTSGNSNLRISQIKIFNSLGIVVKQWQFPANTSRVKLDVSNLSSGLYFIEASDGNNNITQKIMITK